MLVYSLLSAPFYHLFSVFSISCWTDLEQIFLFIIVLEIPDEWEKKRSRSENVANVVHLTRSAFYVSCIAYNVNDVSERDKQANMEWKNQNATEVKDQPNKMCCTDAEVREIFMRKNVYRSLGKLTPVFGSFFFQTIHFGIFL